MITVVSGLMYHVGDVLHVGRSLITFVHVLLVVGSQRPFRPFLGPRRLAVQALLPVIEIVDHVIVIVLPKQGRLIRD